MVTYPVKAINAILLPIYQVPGQLTFHTLWKLSQELQECLDKMEHPNHPYEGYADYMMPQAAYAFYSTTPCTDPNHMGNCFIVPTTSITDNDQKY